MDNLGERNEEKDRALLHPQLLAWCHQINQVSLVLTLVANQPSRTFIQFTCPHLSTVTCVVETSFLSQYSFFSASLVTEPSI